MPIPSYQEFMKPVLKYLFENSNGGRKEICEYCAVELQLSEDNKKELLSSGKQEVYLNRAGWALTYLKKAGLISSPKRSYFEITDRGKTVYHKDLPILNSKYLKQFDEFLEFQNIKIDGQKDAVANIDEDSAQSPTDLIDSGYQQHNKLLKVEILQSISNCSPTFFEKLVVDLIVALGYGGAYKDAASVVGQSGDEGIDGIIKEDRLGLDVIYLQAKRWQGSVGRPEIQKFAGALQGKRARKGIFITTSWFTKEALEYVSLIESKIILIDGNKLTDLMIDCNVGVEVENKIEIKRIDGDYFLDE